MCKLLSLAVLLLLCAHVPAAEKAYVPLEQRLSAEQLRATGLDTLSSEQLALLNQLLSEDRAQTVRAIETEHARDTTGLREAKAPPPQPLSATVTGDVRAWSKGDIVRLDNGQRWRVVDSGIYLGKAVHNPKVTIAPGFMGAWYLQMDGQSPKIKVQRVD